MKAVFVVISLFALWVIQRIVTFVRIVRSIKLVWFYMNLYVDFDANYLPTVTIPDCALYLICLVS